MILPFHSNYTIVVKCLFIDKSIQKVRKKNERKHGQNWHNPLLNSMKICFIFNPTLTNDKLK